MAPNDPRGYPDIDLGFAVSTVIPPGNFWGAKPVYVGYLRGWLVSFWFTPSVGRYKLRIRHRPDLDFARFCDGDDRNKGGWGEVAEDWENVDTKLQAVSILHGFFNEKGIPLYEEARTRQT
ncbi:hypothetical protein [Pseudolabrys sp.]|uniref:hypothetical protein n=1 Tax=Pseudolabrys sp. TaxID=1960880 RepID=UPI003D0B811C